MYDNGDIEMNIESALEIENMLTQSRKSLRCALRRMKQEQVYSPFEKNVATAVAETDRAAVAVRQFITDNTK